MLNAYYLIIIYINIVNGMVFQEENLQKLDYFFSKLRHEHHTTNYKLALEKQIIPFGLRVKKIPTIKPISEDFSNQWNSVLHNSRKRLVQLLLAETQKVVEITQIDFNEELHEEYLESFQEEKLLIEKRMARSKNNLKQNEYVHGLSLKVRNISIVLILGRSLHISYLLKEKKETYHRMTRIKAKRHYHQRKS